MTTLIIFINTLELTADSGGGSLVSELHSLLNLQWTIKVCGGVKITNRRCQYVRSILASQRVRLSVLMFEIIRIVSHVIYSISTTMMKL